MTTEHKICDDCWKRMKSSLKWALILAVVAVITALDPTLVISTWVVIVGSAVLAVNASFIWGRCRLDQRRTRRISEAVQGGEQF